jgi:hypothetical protein
MAHVLFMDIVSYSKMPMDHQKAVLGTLQSVVCATPEFLQAQASQEMIRLPTGDGMALVFFGDAEAAARCALEITKTAISNSLSLILSSHLALTHVAYDSTFAGPSGFVGIRTATWF